MTEPHPQQVLPQMTDVWQQTLHWQPTATQQQLFQSLYQLILTGNTKLNLTRITDPIAFWEKHLWDSLRPMAPLLTDDAETPHNGCGQNPLIVLGPDQSSDPPKPPLKRGASGSPPFRKGGFGGDRNARMIDIGTGAGFPGLPVAIAYPHSSLTLLDATGKKIAFLQTLLAQMAIENATTAIGRAETIGQQPRYREKYDFALLRAVATATVCLEYALPFLKVGGLAVLYRGHWTPAEAEALAGTAEALGACIESTVAFTTPISHGTRHCLYVRKCD
ncbi:MAG: 16S rRNA (guanine(527)-N(7))-methyltransferase RsmG [Hormoscilla sp.]